MIYGEFYFWFSDRLIKGIITEQGCWQPVGRSKDKEGYIWFWFRGKMTRLHRAIYILLHGDIPNFIQVRHICDNPACMNPEHLSEGTAKDNSDDRSKHGHQIYGEQVSTAKLTEAKVETILASNSSIKELAKEYCVSISTIRNILSGRSWKTVKRSVDLGPLGPKIGRMPNKPSLRISQYKVESMKTEEKK